MAELKYWVWLATRKGISVRKLYELLRYYESPEEIYFVRKGAYPKEIGRASCRLKKSGCLKPMKF